MMDFGERLRKCRKERKWSQQQLSDASGVCRRSISTFESGRCMPKSRDTYRLLADALEVDVSYLRGNEAETSDETDEQGNLNGMHQAEELVNEIGSLFAGGSLSDDELDEVMLAMHHHYMIAKEINKKYTPKKFKG